MSVYLAIKLVFQEAPVLIKIGIPVEHAGHAVTGVLKAIALKETAGIRIAIFPYDASLVVNPFLAETQWPSSALPWIGAAF